MNPRAEDLLTCFQSAGGPRWAYFMRVVVMNMNRLFNMMKVCSLFDIVGR